MEGEVRDMRGMSTWWGSKESRKYRRQRNYGGEREEGESTVVEECRARHVYNNAKLPLCTTARLSTQGMSRLNKTVGNQLSHPFPLPNPILDLENRDTLCIKKQNNHTPAQQSQEGVWTRHIAAAAPGSGSS